MLITYPTFKQRIAKSRTILFRGHPLGRRDTGALNKVRYDWKIAEQEAISWLDVYRLALSENMNLLTTAEKGVPLSAVTWAIEYGIPVDIFLPYERAMFVSEWVVYGDNQKKWLAQFEKAQEAKNVLIHTPILFSSKKDVLYSEISVDDFVLYAEIDEFLVTALTENDEAILYWDGYQRDIKHVFNLCKQKDITIKVLNKGLETSDTRYSPYSMDYTF